MKRKQTIYRQSMTGVSQFLPFIVSGCLLTSTAFVSSGERLDAGMVSSLNPFSAWLLSIAKIIMRFVLPVLAGYIASSIADRPGLLAGMVAGALAQEGGSGILGTLIGGFAAGYVVIVLQHITKNLPRSYEGFKTLIVFPIFGVILTALLMMPINYAVTPLAKWLIGWFANMDKITAMVAGGLIGVMLAYDSGGPINKIAYVFAVASLIGNENTLVPSVVMASAGCSGMTISTGCALATLLFPKKFSPSLKTAGKAAWIMGLSYISEGAIPFAVVNRKEVIVSTTLGAAVAGALSGFLQITLSTPIGGIFTVPFADDVVLYLLCFIIGTCITAFMMGALLKDYVEHEEDLGIQE